MSSISAGFTTHATGAKPIKRSTNQGPFRSQKKTAKTHPMLLFRLPTKPRAAYILSLRISLLSTTLNLTARFRSSMWAMWWTAFSLRPLSHCSMENLTPWISNKCKRTSISKRVLIIRVRLWFYLMKQAQHLQQLNLLDLTMPIKCTNPLRVRQRRR